MKIADKTSPRKLLAIFTIALLLLVNGCTRQDERPLDELVDIGTHQLHIHCAGSGNPTIVIDTGVGESSESWEPLRESISQISRVCVYDRAGYGQSEMGPVPRDSQIAADELQMLLKESGETGPYLLVGHSLGGLNMQVFAASFPKEVAGVVLLDPPPLGWIVGDDFPELRELFEQESANMRSRAGAAQASTDPEQQAQAAFLETVASEYEQFFDNTGRQVAAIQSFGQLPLTVIGATEPEPGFGASAQAFREFWNDESRSLARKSEVGKFILAEGSSHHIHLDAPRLLLDEIAQIVQMARN